MGFSEPSGILCDSTAPIPYADASHAKISSKESSKCAKNFWEVNNSFEVLKALSSSSAHLHNTFFRNNLYKGDKIDDKLGRNLP